MINSKPKTQQSRKFGLPQVVKSWDMFGAQVPSFNLRGRDVVKSSAGACASIVILLLTLAFALLKFKNLVEKKNPTVMTNTSSLENGTRFNTGADGFMMAFSATNPETKEHLSDTDYIRWSVSFTEKIGETWNEIDKELHRCTDIDMAKFYPPENPA